MTAEELPEKQFAFVFDQHDGPLNLREIPLPEIDDQDVLVKVLYTGVCHTDLHVWKGDFPIESKSPPLVGGHEGAGIVVKLGKNVKNFKVGDRAGIKWLNGSCLACEQCRRGFENTCVNTLCSGLTRDGTFQQYAAVKATEATPIPEGLDLTRVAPILCAGVTAYRALKESKVKAGQTICITGAGGGLGSLAIQYAVAMGMRVLALDLHNKEEHCRKMGAELFLDPFNSKNLIEDVMRVTDGGPHGVLCLAAQDTPMTMATQYVRTQGTVVLVALPKDGKCHLDVFWSVLRCVKVVGSYVGTRQDAIEALDFLQRGKIEVPVEVRPFKELPHIYDQMIKQELIGRVVIDLSDLS